MGIRNGAVGAARLPKIRVLTVDDFVFRRNRTSSQGRCEYAESASRLHALVTAAFAAPSPYRRCERATTCAAMSGTLASRKFWPIMRNSQYQDLGVKPRGARLGIRNGARGAVRLPYILVLIVHGLSDQREERITTCYEYRV